MPTTPYFLIVLVFIIFCVLIVVLAIAALSRLVNWQLDRMIRNDKKEFKKRKRKRSEGTVAIVVDYEQD